MAEDINANARIMLSILDDPSLLLVDQQGHAYSASSFNGSMYRNYANAAIANNVDAYGYLSQMRFGPKSAAYLDAQGIWMLMPPDQIRSGDSLAVTRPVAAAPIPLPVQNQPSGGDFTFGGQTTQSHATQTNNPLLPNNTPNPTIPGSLNPGAAANAQDVAMGSTQSAGPQRDIWDIAINGPDQAQGAGGAGGNGSGVDPKLIMYGLIALVAVAALK